MTTPFVPPSPPSPPADITWQKQTPTVDVNYSFWTPVNAPILSETFILDETRLK